MIPAELRRRRRGCRARAKPRSMGGRKMRPLVPSIIMGRVRYLGNKMDNLSSVENRESSILCFTETWLHSDHSASISGFRTIWAGGDVTWEGLQFLWVTGGAVSDILRWRDVSALGSLNFKTWVCGRIICHREVSSAILIRSTFPCQLISLQIQRNCEDQVFWFLRVL